MKRTDEKYVPHIARLERKMNGVLDPMEETIGLYRVIFLPAPDADETERGEQGKKWIAGTIKKIEHSCNSQCDCGWSPKFLKKQPRRPYQKGGP